MKCIMCNKELEPDSDKEAPYHEACMARCNAKINANKCAYCGEPKDSSVLSSRHCKDHVYSGYG